MKHAGDDNSVTVDEVDDSIRKRIRKNLPKFLVVNLADMRIRFQASNGCSDRSQKIIAEPFPLAIVPIPSFAQI